MHVENKYKQILIIQFVFLIYSIISVVAKKAALYNTFTLNFIVLFSFEIILLFLYAIIWQQVLKKVDITVAYANKGTTIFWTILWAAWFFNEKVTVNNIIGGIIVFIGIAVIFKDA